MDCSDPIWRELLAKEFSAPYFLELKNFLQAEKKSGAQIYPPEHLILNALNSTPFDKVKVVILGQDPYHGKGQAHGLCFSVPDGIEPPPSLRNIFKELNSDLGNPIPQSGNLTDWAKAGVLLLNTSLTVRAGQAGSHQGKGWEIFTDAIIRLLSEKKSGLVFLLWGNPAQEKKVLIDSHKHHILSTSHPSPLSSYRGFLGCKHFSKARDLTGVDWELKGKLLEPILVL